MLSLFYVILGLLIKKNLKNIILLFMPLIKIILEDRLKLHSATIKLLKKTLGSVLNKNSFSLKGIKMLIGKHLLV